MVWRRLLRDFRQIHLIAEFDLRKPVCCEKQGRFCVWSPNCNQYRVYEMDTVRPVEQPRVANKRSNEKLPGSFIWTGLHGFIL